MSQRRAIGVPVRRGPRLVATQGGVTLGDGRAFDPHSVIPGGRYNVYDCERGHELLSIDLDEGVTPALTHCPFDQTTASSRFYRVHGPAAFLPVVFVWRLATNGERKWERRNGFDHYARGGLARDVLA